MRAQDLRSEWVRCCLALLLVASPATAAPKFLDLTPPDGEVLTAEEVVLGGEVEDAVRVTVAGETIPLTGGRFTAGPFPLTRCPAEFLLTATSSDGQRASVVHRVDCDLKPPRILVELPLERRVNASPVRVRGRATDPHLREVLVAGRPAELSGDRFEARVPIPEGEQTIEVVARDRFGHESRQELALTLDTTPPAVEITTDGVPLAGGETFGGAVRPRVAAGDGARLRIRLNGQPWQPGGTIAEEGRYVLEVEATDAVGNRTRREVRFAIDRTPPRVSFSKRTARVLSASEVTVEGRAAGAVAVSVDAVPATLQGERFTAGPFALGEGEQRFTVVAVDAAGNRSETELELKNDITAPVITITSPADGAMVGTTPITVTGTTADTDLATVTIGTVDGTVDGTSFTVAGVELSAGVNALTVIATDTFGNASETLLTVTLDLTPPAIAVTVGDNEPLIHQSVFPGPIAPVITVTDTYDPNVEAVAELDDLAWTSGSRIEDPGWHKLSVSATDAAGNSAAVLLGFEIEAGPPVFESLSPADGTVVSAASVTLVGRVSGAVEVTVGPDPVALVGEEFVKALDLVEGDNGFTLVATSAGGQSSAPLEYRLVRDSAEPNLTLASPAAGEVRAERNLTVSGTVSDPHLSWVRVNGQEATIVDSSFTVTGIVLAEGPNTIRARAEDAAGNVAEVERTVDLDTRAPEVEIRDPASGTVVPGPTLTLRGTARDPHLERVEVDGTTAQLGGESWSIIVPLEEGENRVVVEAFDTLGHRGEATVDIARASDVPEIRIEEPAAGLVTPADEIAVSGTVSGCEMVEVEDEMVEICPTVTVNGDAAEVTGGSFVAPAVEIVEGENRLLARAVDAQGKNGVHTVTVVRDSQGPSVVSSEPVNGARGIERQPTIAVSFSEAMAAPSEQAWQLAVDGIEVSASATASEEVIRFQADEQLPATTEVSLQLGAGLTDAVGNALVDPQTLSFITAASALEAPAITTAPPTSPYFVCAASWTFSGTTVARAKVRVEGGATTVEAWADGEGEFSVEVSLMPNRLNRLTMTAEDGDGNISSPAVYEIVRDCEPPSVVDAESTVEELIVRFSEPVAAATVVSAIAVSAADGPVAGVASLTGAAEATFTPAPAGALLLTVSQEVTDLAGNALAYPYTRLFSDETGSFFRGTVIDDSTGRPLAGARVVVTAIDGVVPDPLPEQTTSDDGHFQIAVPAGSHDVTVARTGYTPVFRSVTTSAGLGTEVFDPRLTPASAPETVPAAGATVSVGDALALTLPSDSLDEATTVTLTAVGEQGLPAFMHYGWSPRGAVWLDLDPDLPEGASATLSLPVEAPDGTELVAARLDLETLQWWAVDSYLVVDGRLSFPVSGLGAYAALAGDGGALAPPPAVAGQVLGSSPKPLGSEVTAAAVSFDPPQVLPTETSMGTAVYTLVSEAASGVPLSLIIREELSLLGGSLRRQPPYSADLVLYHAADGTARSRFRLRPSDTARRLPISSGREEVVVEHFEDATLGGNVVGIAGGSVTNGEGDQLDVAPESLFAETAIVLERRAASDLPLPPPSGAEIRGVIALVFDAAELANPATFTLALAAEERPQADDVGLLLQVIEVNGAWHYRVVAELEPLVDTGWRTKAIDAADLPWPGVRSAGQYVFVELTAPVAFVRGTALSIDGVPLAGALVGSASVEWVQLADAEGRYALPVGLGEAEITVTNPANGNAVTTTVTVGEADSRVDLDPQVRIVGPRVISTSPAPGETGVLVGWEPTINFSEPVDESSLAAGITLWNADRPVEITCDAQGALVRVLPKATLIPGADHELRIGYGIRDLHGYMLMAPVTVDFRTQEPIPSTEVDPAKIHLIEPDANGEARVVGDPGAVPPGRLVWAENLTAYASVPSVATDIDGSFELTIRSELDDVLLLFIEVPGGNALIHLLGPFISEDRRAVWVGPQATRFTTVDGLTVIAEEGTFTHLAQVRIEPQSLAEAPAPPLNEEQFTPVYAFELDFGGAEAQKPLQIRLPAPADAEEIVYMLNRMVEVHGRRAWMMHDLMWLDGDELTSEQALETQEQLIMVGSTKSGDGPLNLPPNRPPFSYKNYLPGAAFPGQYQALAPIFPMLYVGFPYPMYQFISIWNTAIEGVVAAINREVGRLLEYDAVLIPAFLNAEYPLEVWELATGYLLFEGTFGPYDNGDEIILLPPDTFGDSDPAMPVHGSPVRFFRLFFSEIPAGTLDSGITFTFDADDEQLRVEGEPGAVDPEVEIILLNAETGMDVSDYANPDGSFILITEAVANQRYVLAIGAVIAPDEDLEISFSEALDSELAGITVRDSLNVEPGYEIHPVGSTETVRVSSKTQWTAGETYTLILGPSLSDAVGNTWGHLLEVRFEVEQGRVLDTYNLAQVRDVAQLGSMLFVAGGTAGLVVLDASDPANIRNVIDGDITFPFPENDSARGVAVDPHGRVLVAGGGVASPGQLKIFDPLALDPEAVAADPDNPEVRYAAFQGSSLISDLQGGTGTQLPEGTPYEVAVMSNDQRDRWNVGQEPPADLIVMPPELIQPILLTVGGAAYPGSQVLLYNVDTDDLLQAEADTEGSFQITTTVHVGDSLELLRNGNLVTRWLAGRPLSGDLWVTPITSLAPLTLTVTGAAGPGLPVTLKNLTTVHWHRIDADATGQFEISIEVRRGDEVELLRNVDSFAYVALHNAGVEVVDVNSFYHEPNVIQSSVLGVYSGLGDPDLSLCDETISHLGGVLDIGSMIDLSNPHPLTVVGLVNARGLVLLESDPNSVGQMYFVSDGCAEIDGNASVKGLEVVQHYPFDFNGDGRFTSEEYGDWVLVAHGGDESLLVFNVTDRENVTLEGRIELPGPAYELSIDRDSRRVFVSASDQGLYVVDLDLPPQMEMLDADGDGDDDRVVETIPLGGNNNTPSHLLPEWGLAFAGGLDRGVTSVAVGEPKLVAVAPGLDGARRVIARLAPLGVPTAPEDPTNPTSPELAGTFYLLAYLPGVIGDQVTVDVLSLGAGGLPSDPPGDPALITDLPPTALAGTEAVVLRRLAQDPWDDGYQLFQSEEIVVLADLRAARAYQRSELEEEQCVRCDQPDDGVERPELLSGETVAVRWSAASRALLEPIYGKVLLDESELELESVRWETSPAVRQEPTLSPSYGEGDVAPGTLLHSGEMSLSAVDLSLRGRGIDFSFQRTYRNQTTGGGPLGPGWDHNYRQRLRELPNGDVEYYDGRGRRELFQLIGGHLRPPAGLFVDFTRSAAGWVMIDRQHTVVRFDRYGRMVSIADPSKISDETGNEMVLHYNRASRLEAIVDTLDRVMTFEYDADGRLIRLADFDEREVVYTYDAGRLTEVRSPTVKVGLSQFPEGLTTTYDYEPDDSAPLALRLAHRDNLTALTDPRGIKWLEMTYTDEDDDDRKEEVTGQVWGEYSLSIDYDFDLRRTEVTDRRSFLRTYKHNEDGQRVSFTDPLGKETTTEYAESGLMEKATFPLGRVESFTHASTGPWRSRGNLLLLKVTPDERGSNSTGSGMCSPEQEVTCRNPPPDGVSVCECSYQPETAATYDPRVNLPDTLTDRLGNQLDIQRDEHGLITSTTLPTGKTVGFEYNPWGQLISETGPLGAVKTYTYYEEGPSRGYLHTQTFGGLTTEYEYDARGNITAIIDPRGVRTENVWNELDWLVSVTRAASPSSDGALALSYTTSYGYDANGNVTAEHIPYGEDGQQHTIDITTYGALNDTLTISRQLEPDGPSITSTLTYDANFNLETVTDPEGHVHVFTYEDRNLLSKAVLGDGLVTEHFYYDDEHNLERNVDGRSQDWTKSYDGHGRLKEEVDPLGHRTLTSYDAGDNLTLIETVDAEGEVTARKVNVYDALNRLTDVHESLFIDTGETQATTHWEYDAASNLLSVTDPENRVTTYSYDAAERLESVTDPAGNVTTFVLDGNGNPITTINTEIVPDGEGIGAIEVTSTATYDALNRRVGTTDDLTNTTQYVYDAHDNVIHTIDPELFVTSATFDALGRPLSSTLPEGITVTNTWDGNSNLLTYVDALNKTTEYTYDALNRPTLLEFADETTWSWDYDESHNVKQIIDGNGTVVDQVWDKANRLESRTVTPAPGVEGAMSETFIWDSLNRLSFSQSGSAVTTKTYDSLSRVIAESVAGREVGYEYNLAGGMTSLTYPSGLIVTRDLDPLDRPLSILRDDDESAGYQYRGPHLRHQKTLGNGLVGALDYDAARRLVEQQYTADNGATVMHETLAWSPRGLKVSQVRADVTGADRVMAHDAAGRLTEVGCGALSVVNNTTASAATVLELAAGWSYSYDEVQNLTARSARRGGVATEVSLDPDTSGRHRPARIGAVDLEWDANGNLIRKGDQHFYYDFANRLVRVSRDGVGDVVLYEYDTQGRRVKKTVDGTTTDYMWAGWQVIEEYTDSQLSARRVFGAGLDEIVHAELDLVGDGTLNTEFYPLYDETGNLVAATGAGGVPIERYDYSPFGEQRILVDAMPPEIVQVRIVDGELWIEVSEDVTGEALSAAIAAEELTLIDDATQLPLAIDAVLPPAAGLQARRRLVVSVDPVPAAGTAVTLRCEPPVLRDPFFNQLAETFELPFVWSDTDVVLHDAAAPQWLQVVVRSGQLVVRLSEEVDLTSAAAAILVDGAGLTWSLDEDHYALHSIESLTAGPHQLRITTGLLDLAGQALAAAYEISFEMSSADASLLLAQAPDPRHIASTAMGNLYGFHGRPLDAETGLLYFRNRYYDPEMGRFISVDPMGFADGPSPYMFAQNSPGDYSDPMGLFSKFFTKKVTDRLGSEVDKQAVKMEKSINNKITGWVTGKLKQLDSWVVGKIREHTYGPEQKSLLFTVGMVRGLMKFVGSGSKTAYEMATGVLTYRTGVTAKAKELGVNFIKDPEGTIEEISQTVRNFDFKEVNRQVLDGLERGINDFIDASPEKQGEIFGEVVLANIITAGGGTFTKPYVHLTKAKHIRRTLDGVKATITKVCQIKIGRSRARRVAALRFAPSKLRSWLAGERLSPFAKRHLETVRSKAEDILINALLTPKQTVQKINNFIDATAEFDFEEFQSDPLAAAKKLSRGIAGDGKKKPEGSTGH